MLALSSAISVQLSIISVLSFSISELSNKFSILSFVIFLFLRHRFCTVVLHFRAVVCHCGIIRTHFDSVIIHFRLSVIKFSSVNSLLNSLFLSSCSRNILNKQTSSILSNYFYIYTYNQTCYEKKPAYASERGCRARLRFLR